MHACMRAGRVKWRSHRAAVFHNPFLAFQSIATGLQPYQHLATTLSTPCYKPSTLHPFNPWRQAFNPFTLRTIPTLQYKPSRQAGAKGSTGEASRRSRWEDGQAPATEEDRMGLAQVHAETEVEDFCRIAAALVVNVGTLTPSWAASMKLAAATAARHGKPWVLDPVGAGATPFRTQVLSAFAFLSVRVRGCLSED